MFLKEFEQDSDEVIDSAIKNGLKYIILPNIDSSTIHALVKTCEKYSGFCLPAMGLHPTSVKNDYENELKIIEQWLQEERFYAVGESGIDLYWDKTYFQQQKKAFIRQAELAVHYKLPLIIHSRNSLDEIFSLLDEFNKPELTGIFHCFPGNSEQAKKVLDYGFKIGIGGVITFKNSGTSEVIKNIDLNEIVLETDSPFLAPVPHRGKRNESSYLNLIAEKIADIKSTSIENVADITTKNAIELFNLPQE